MFKGEPRAQALELVLGELFGPQLKMQVVMFLGELVPTIFRLAELERKRLTLSMVSSRTKSGRSNCNVDLSLVNLSRRSVCDLNPGRT
jgi:hypothetical protein